MHGCAVALPLGSPQFKIDVTGMKKVRLQTILIAFRIGGLHIALLMCFLLLPTAAGAASAIAQSFTTKSTEIIPGTVVSLVASTADEVEPATNAGSAAQLVGVVVDEPLVQLSGDAARNVQVASAGTTDVLVSDINGTVKEGDRLAASPITGVAMKARASGEVIGTARAALDSVSTTTRTVTDRAGKPVTVKIGRVPAGIALEYYAGSDASALSAFIPAFVQNIADAVASKPVAPIRVLLGLLVIVLGFVAVVVILNAAIRNGIISIGRNPLAGGALRRGLVDVGLSVIGILLIVSALAYGILAI